MDRRKTILTAALLVIAFGLVVWWFWSSRAPATTPVATENPTPQGEGAGVVFVPQEGATPIPVGQGDSTIANATTTRLARLFAERFGTFTSQGNFEDMTDLTSVVSASFRTWMTQTYVPSLRAKYPSTTYVGQTTRVLGTTTEQSSESAATILVRTQQETVEANGPAVVVNQSLRLKLVKEGDRWVVDSAVWVTSP